MDMLSGMDYLEAEIVCKKNKSFEKKTWKERISEFDGLWIYDESIYNKASDPIGLRAGIEAYRDMLEGKPSGYMISLDATSSGLQLLSILISCPISWNLCGGDHTQRVDTYRVLYKAMNLGDYLTNEEVKKAIMTALYGSEEIPDRTFGDKVDIFYETLEKMLPGAWELNIALQDLWAKIKKSSYSWTMPDNFHCHIDTTTPVYTNFNFLGEEFSIKKHENKRPKFHKGLGPNLIHSVDSFIVREMARRCMYDKEVITRVINSLDSKNTEGQNKQMVELLWSMYKSTGILSYRILDYLDSGNMGLVNPMTIAKLIKELPEQPFELITIHDNFKCHPNYGNDVRKQYNKILLSLNKSQLLRFMVRQVTNQPNLRVTQVGLISEESILNSNYSLS
jgi:hypothetical protein